jgi:hypothetical protein
MISTVVWTGDAGGTGELVIGLGPAPWDPDKFVRLPFEALAVATATLACGTDATGAEALGVLLDTAKPVRPETAPDEAGFPKSMLATASPDVVRLSRVGAPIIGVPVGIG